MNSYKENIFYWLKVNLLTVLLITLSTILLTLVVEIFLIGIESVYLSVVLCGFFVVVLFYLKKKSDNSILFFSFWISLLAFTGSVLLPVIFQPKLCSGEFYIVPYRIFIITILVEYTTKTI